MTRENVKKNMNIISAFADGRDIQMLNERGKWVDLTEREGLPMGTLEEKPNIFRIKPESEYRPFKDAEECWQEMLKHQPFGWVNYNGYRISIATVMRSAVIFTNNKGYNFTFEQAFEECAFVDRQPFGVKMNE